MVPFYIAASVAPGSKVNLMMPLGALAGAWVFSLIVCGVITTCSVFVQPVGKARPWVMGAISMAIVAVTWPLIQWSLRYVMAKYRLVDTG